MADPETAQRAKLGPIFKNNHINPDPKTFPSHRGKLIQYHGHSDLDISPKRSHSFLRSSSAAWDKYNQIRILR
jgi:hypothetical protein